MTILLDEQWELRMLLSKIKEKKVKWINSINDVNYGPVIFFGNEFFDSLAIKQIYKKNLIDWQR